MPVQHCKPLKIVSTKYCVVWQCVDCQSVQLQFGDLTLRLSPQQMQGIAHGLQEAVLRTGTLQTGSDGILKKSSLPN